MNLKLCIMFNITILQKVSGQQLKMQNSADKEGISHRVHETNTLG